MGPSPNEVPEVVLLGALVVLDLVVDHRGIEVALHGLGFLIGHRLEVDYGDELTGVERLFDRRHVLVGLLSPQDIVPRPV